MSAVAQKIYSWCSLSINFLGIGKKIVFSIGFYSARVIYPLFFQKARRLWDLEPSSRVLVNNVYNGAVKARKAKVIIIIAFYNDDDDCQS